VQTHELGDDLDDAARAITARHVDRQTLPCPFVDNRQALERLASRTRVEHEIVVRKAKRLSYSGAYERTIWEQDSRTNQ
jgi:hypothetical protein